MTKIISLIILFLTLSSFSFSQGKIKIGKNSYIYDSSGIVVIQATSFKVNSNSWILPKDLNSTIAGNGLSLNNTLGLRFNAGTGMVIGSNDTVVTNQVLSFGQLDSISIGGLIVKTTNSALTLPDTLSFKNKVKILASDGSGIEWTAHGDNFQLGILSLPTPFSGLTFSMPADGNSKFRWREGSMLFATLDSSNGFVVDAPIVITGSTSYFQLPNLTTAERTALTPSAGTMVFDSDENRFYKYDGTSWASF